MNAQLLQYADRIDAMSLRERAMVFVACVFVLVSLVFNALIDPLQAREKRLSQQVLEQQTQTRALQLQIQALAQPKDAAAENAQLAKLKQLRTQSAEIASDLAQRESRFVKPQRIALMIENMLQKNRQVSLLSMRNLPVVPLSAASVQAATSTPVTAPGTAPAPAAAQGVYRHGVEISLKGSYLGLLDYMVMLEKMPEQVYMGGADLTADGHGAATMKLTLYTLSLEKAWLAI